MSAQPSVFEALAPRLALAHRQRQDMYEAFTRAKLEAEKKLLEEERVLAHRELQLCRAGVGFNQRVYVKQRMKKLEEARRRVERALKRVPASWEEMAA